MAPAIMTHTVDTGKSKGPRQSRTHSLRSVAIESVSDAYGTDECADPVNFGHYRLISVIERGGCLPQSSIKTAPALPAGTRLLHIGPMKTGTTSLQRALAGQRKALLGHGVRYPGKSFNHRRPIGAFLGLRVLKQNRVGAVGRAAAKLESDPSVPKMRAWKQLIRETKREKSRRVVISHELAADAQESSARRLIEALGDKTHVVVTLRSSESVLPSLWAQLLKSGLDTPLDTWAQRLLDNDPAVPARTRRQFDHAGLVERWSSIIGPENVTVVVADDSDPTILTRAFEDLLDLPHGFLTDFPTDGFSSNRSLRLAEAELLLQLNAMCRDIGVDWGTYTRLIQGGAVRRLRKVRTPRSDEARVQLPPWARKRCQDLGADAARRITAAGVNIVGDLSALSSPQTLDRHVEAELTDVPIDVAAEAMRGMLLGAVKHDTVIESDSKRLEPAQRAESLFSTRELASALKNSALHKIMKPK